MLCDGVVADEVVGAFKVMGLSFSHAIVIPHIGIAYTRDRLVSLLVSLCAYVVTLRTWCTDIVSLFSFKLAAQVSADAYRVNITVWSSSVWSILL